MIRACRWYILTALVAAGLPIASATAQPPEQPYDFDVNLAEKPGDVQNMITEYSSGLPGLPFPQMTEVALAGPISIWLFDEAVQFLDLLVQTDKQDYQWPLDQQSCAGHLAIEMPAVSAAQQGGNCPSVATSLQQALAVDGACQDAAQPERYVLDYPPGVINDQNTNSVLDLIGVMGSTLTDFPPLYDGILPEGFEDQLKDILRKLRYEELYPNLVTEVDSLTHAAALIAENSSCFEDEQAAVLSDQINTLLGETTYWRDHFQALASEGQAQHQREELRLAAISRDRSPLPYPTLTQADREFLAFWLGAVYWRLRGGGFILLDGTREYRRLGLRRPFNVIGELSGGDDGKEAADGVYCEIFSGWGEWFDMGTSPGEDKYYDLVKMTNRGYEQIRTAAEGSNLCLIPDPPFVLDPQGLAEKGYDTRQLYAGGLSMGPCYYYAWDQLFPWTWAADMAPPYIQGVDIPTAIGELCTGGSIALGMTRSLLKGREVSPSPVAGAEAILHLRATDTDDRGCTLADTVAELTVIPLANGGGSLPPWQDISLVEDYPYVFSGGVEEFTDPLTGVTEYIISVGSERCFSEGPRELSIRVGGTIINETVLLDVPCPQITIADVHFQAMPTEVAADGVSSAEVAIEVLDSCGQPAFGRVVALELTGGISATLSNYMPTTADSPGSDIDGVATVEVSSNEQGSLGLEATIDGATYASAADLVVFVQPDPSAPSDPTGPSGSDPAAPGERSPEGSDGDAVGSTSGCATSDLSGNESTLLLMLMVLAILVRRRSGAACPTPSGHR